MNPLITPVESTRLAPQSYEIAMAQTRFGRPSGVWLECKGCNRNDVIVGSKDGSTVDQTTPDDHCAAIFRHHGWTGEGSKMLNQHCPDCSRQEAAA